MKSILILGAGRSSSSLIKYLLDHSGSNGWKIVVTDVDVASAAKKLNGHTNGEAIALNAEDQEKRRELIRNSDLVISMLPASMHPDVAEDCIALRRDLITPSYISDRMMSLDKPAREKGILLLNEMGVDPGIDHMSAMKIIHQIQKENGQLESFESFTGGLIAPESDNNPWNYKITWNPRNVVLAGAGGMARYLENGKEKFIPYHRLFSRLTEIEVPGNGKFEGYANRDSLGYRKIYGIENIPSIFRGTLRKPGFCKAWNALIQLGYTDDTVLIPGLEDMTWKMLTLSFTSITDTRNPDPYLKSYLQIDDTDLARIKWLGLLDDSKTGLAPATPASALQHLIEKKWKLSKGDKDMIVMWHRFKFKQNSENWQVESSLVVKGDDEVNTAMAKTVGLPIAVAAKHILTGKLKLEGVQLPVIPELYEPVLSELEELGIIFTENYSRLAQ